MQTARNAVEIRSLMNEAMEDVYDALKEEGPMTREEIQMVCHLTENQAMSALNTLMEDDLVDRERSAKDGRKWVYRIENMRTVL